MRPLCALPPALPRRAALSACAGLALLLGGCATRRPAGEAGLAFWSGRLSLAVRSEPPQSFTSGFELRGHAQEGLLQLSTPLGTTLAQARWSPGQAWLDSGGRQRSFASLEDLLRELTGAALPVAALFDWLKGIPTDANGWQADLSARDEGRLIARRLSPAPAVELRLLIEP